MTPDKTPPVSNCCHAPMRTGGKYKSGTLYHICNACNEPCDAEWKPAPIRTPPSTGPAVPPFPTLTKVQQAEIDPQFPEPTRAYFAWKKTALPKCSDTCTPEVKFGWDAGVEWANAQLAARVTELERANVELAADKARLDWLSENTAYIMLARKNALAMENMANGGNGWEGNKLRAAIDAARAKTAQ